MRTSAPSERIRSAFTFGDVEGTKISARCPRVRAAYATASPKFPPEAAMTPTAGTSEASILLNAPRVLNEPVCCISSSFSVTRQGSPNAPGSSSSTGVRRT